MGKNLIPFKMAKGMFYVKMLNFLGITRMENHQKNSQLKDKPWHASNENFLEKFMQVFCENECAMLTK